MLINDYQSFAMSPIDTDMFTNWSLMLCYFQLTIDEGTQSQSFKGHIPHDVLCT